MRLGTVLSIITRAINTRLRFPLQVWRGCVGMDNALCQKPPLQVLGEIQIPSLDSGWSQNFMNNSGCTEFKSLLSALDCIAALVAAVLAFPISKTLYETGQIPII